MPSLLVEPAGQLPFAVQIFKPMTTIGASTESDVSIQRRGLEATHAQISREGDEHFIVGFTRDMTVNGRREKRRKLEDQDVVRIGEVKLVFRKHDDIAAADEPRALTVEARSAYRRIHEFSMKLLSNASTESLIETILDAIVELTGADKGFLVLLEEGDRAVVRASRNVLRKDVQQSLDQLSDSILRKVIETKQPIIVADALRDEQFNASESVVNLKLLSVMCCPLLDRGDLHGLLYVGNDGASNVFDGAALDVMNVFAAQASLLLSAAQRMEDLRREKSRLEDTLEDMRFGGVIGASDSMKDVFKRVHKVAAAEISVLITGETGTGKELIAREIHRGSRRARGPFVAVNCGAIPETLLESELFGHARGAFTGAVANKAGRFQAAGGGTLFLDEIGEMPVALQVKILRAIQEHVVTRVGDTKPEPVDIRIIAATNRVLEDEIRLGRFREDLFYRLNVVGIHLPPLRERGADVDLIARYLLSKATTEYGGNVSGFSKSCMVAIHKYRWPGNVRQLENRIRKAVVLAEKPLLTAEDLDLRPEDVEDILPLGEAKERFQTRYINEVLERNGGNRTKTAKDLGVDPRTIFRHLEKIQDPIPPEDGSAGLEITPRSEGPWPGITAPEGEST